MTMGIVLTPFPLFPWGEASVNAVKIGSAVPLAGRECGSKINSSKSLFSRSYHAI